MRHWQILVLLIAGLFAPSVHAQYSDGRIKIGVLTDLGGALTESTGRGSVEAAQLAVEDFGGAINGTEIIVVVADHQNNPAVAVEIVSRWFDDGVDMVVDIPNSAVALAVQKLAAERNRIAMVSSAASSDLTGRACTGTTVHWTYDTRALAGVTGGALVASGLKKFFFITADYAFGHILEKEASDVVKAGGGVVSGAMRFKANNVDFSAILLQAQQSNADALVLASAGADTQNAINQAAEFGILQTNQKFASLLLVINEVRALGLPTTRGILLTEGYYWNLDDQTRAFASRFSARRGGMMPNMYQAGVASAVLHYLKAVKAAGTDATEVVMETMRATPINDFMTRDGKLRADGRVLRDMYLFQVKNPAESQGPWDLYSLVKVVPGEQAFRPLIESECRLIKK
jgi:branched-chain amino acid transport system substrate-binding protein